MLKRAYRAMQQRLDAAWAERDADTPLQAPDEALMLASIVEKETGSAADRGRVAGVFVNRLRLGMPLQTDPTVIYGLGAAFDGNLRKRDLQADTPYNTYTRAGLPPTPIAMPGKASLLAAVQPGADARRSTSSSRGDGSSQFSDTLDEHNRAVNQLPAQAASAAVTRPLHHLRRHRRRRQVDPHRSARRARCARAGASVVVHARAGRHAAGRAAARARAARRRWTR